MLVALPFHQARDGIPGAGLLGIETVGKLPLKSDIIKKNSHKTKKGGEREGGRRG